MDTWLVISLVVVALLVVTGVAYHWYTHRTPPTPAFPVQYLSGGASYMITLGIGTPSEIPAFLLFGLSTGGATPPTETAFSHVYMYGRRRR